MIYPGRWLFLPSSRTAKGTAFLWVYVSVSRPQQGRVVRSLSLQLQALKGDIEGFRWRHLCLRITNFNMLEV